MSNKIISLSVIASSPSVIPNGILTIYSDKFTVEGDGKIISCEWDNINKVSFRHTRVTKKRMLFKKHVDAMIIVDNSHRQPAEFLFEASSEVVEKAIRAIQDYIAKTSKKEAEINTAQENKTTDDPCNKYLSFIKNQTLLQWCQTPLWKQNRLTIKAVYNEWALTLYKKRITSMLQAQTQRSTMSSRSQDLLAQAISKEITLISSAESISCIREIKKAFPDQKVFMDDQDTEQLCRLFVRYIVSESNSGIDVSIHLGALAEADLLILRQKTLFAGNIPHIPLFSYGKLEDSGKDIRLSEDEITLWNYFKPLLFHYNNGYRHFYSDLDNPSRKTSINMSPLRAPLNFSSYSAESAQSSLLRQAFANDRSFIPISSWHNPNDPFVRWSDASQPWLSKILSDEQIHAIMSSNKYVPSPRNHFYIDFNPRFIRVIEEEHSIDILFAKWNEMLDAALDQLAIEYSREENDAKRKDDALKAFLKP